MANIRRRGDTWQFRVSDGYDITGKQIVYTKTWKPDRKMTEKQARKEAERQALLFEEKCNRGEYLDGSVKFADFAQIWFEKYAKKQLRKTTIASYAGMLPRINAIIGHIKLEKMQPQRIMECMDTLKAQGKKSSSAKYKATQSIEEILQASRLSKNKLSKLAGVSSSVVLSACRGEHISAPSADKLSMALNRPELFMQIEQGHDISGKTLQNHFRLISSILDTAVKWQIIVSNPCERVAPPKAERREAEYLEEKEITALLDALEYEPLKYRTFVILSLYSGMRRGEVCGLTWADIDMENGIVDINKSSLYAPGTGVFEDDTKNKSSRRSIKIDESVIVLLRLLKAHQDETRRDLQTYWRGAPGENCRVFTQDNGEPINPTTMTRWFNKFTKKHNLPNVHLHTLRHTNASLMIASNVDLRTVSKRLGHAQTSTTLNIYTHAIQSADEKASEAISGLIKRAEHA